MYRFLSIVYINISIWTRTTAVPNAAYGVIALRMTPLRAQYRCCPSFSHVRIKYIHSGILGTSTKPSRAAHKEQQTEPRCLEAITFEMKGFTGL